MKVLMALVAGLFFATLGSAWAQDQNLGPACDGTVETPDRLEPSALPDTASALESAKKAEELRLQSYGQKRDNLLNQAICAPSQERRVVIVKRYVKIVNKYCASKRKLATINKRLDALEERVGQIEDRTQVLEQRVSQIPSTYATKDELEKLAGEVKEAVKPPSYGLAVRALLPLLLLMLVAGILLAVIVRKRLA